MCYAKKRARVRVFADFVLHPPLRRPLWVATLTCSGRTGASNHKCLGALESSTNQPSGQPVGGGEGKNLAKTRTRAAFLPAEGGELDYGGRLWRDCGDATLSLWLAHRYRESFCLACAAGVRIKKTPQNSNSGAFLHRMDPRRVLGE